MTTVRRAAGFTGLAPANLAADLPYFAPGSCADQLRQFGQAVWPRHEEEMKRQGLPLDKKSSGFTLWVDGVETK